MSQTSGRGKAAPSPQWLQQMLQRGFSALQAGRVKEAGECCRQVLSAKPDLAEGHFLVGLVAREMQDRRTAISAFGSVTKLKPDHAAAYAHLAQIFMKAGQPNRGYKASTQSVTVSATVSQSRSSIMAWGMVLNTMGSTPNARAVSSTSEILNSASALPPRTSVLQGMRAAALGRSTPDMSINALRDSDCT